MQLADMGWNDHFAENFSEHAAIGYIPGRVAVGHATCYDVYTESGILTAEVSGAFRYAALSKVDWPVVGDFVALEPRGDNAKATIHAVLPRRTKFSRKEPGARTEEQIVAANFDTVFIVCGLDNDFNLRRIERYVATAWQSGAMPVIVLNKADLCDDLDDVVAQVEAVAIGTPVHTTSARESRGMEELRTYLTRGATVALIGSSGVGKSSIVNALLGEERLKTQNVREDDSRGRHTTTHRELIAVHTGGMLLDTPGMRELQVWSESDATAADGFEDIQTLMAACRFRDCQHDKEPGCAVRSALDGGSLDAARYESYLKLGREQSRLAQRQAQKERSLAKVLSQRTQRRISRKERIEL